MDKIIEQRIRAYGEIRPRGQYSPITIKTYVSNITNLHNLVEGDVEFSNLDFLKDHEKVEDALSGTPATKRNYMNACVVALHTEDTPNTDLIKLYEIKREIMNTKATAIKKDGLTTAQQKVLDVVPKQKMLDFVDGLHLADHLNNHNDFMMALILKIHKSYPFRNELAEMKFIKIRRYYELQAIDETKNMNWCVVSKDKCKFIINVYKTSKTYGQRIIEVEPPLTAYIHAWILKVRKIDIKDLNEKPFLCWMNGNELNRNQMTHKLSDYTNKHLGAKISTTLLAKYFSPELSSKPTTTAELFEIQQKADDRGHSVKTHLNEYNLSK